jgi:hypothetical protein
MIHPMDLLPPDGCDTDPEGCVASLRWSGLPLPSDGGDDTKELRRRLTAAGLFWCPEPPGKKICPIDEWQNKCGQFDAEQDYSTKFGPLTNTALYGPDLFLTDIDVDDPADVAGILAMAQDILGKALCVRYRANSARRAVFVPDEL